MGRELSDTVKEVLSTRSEAVAQRMREGVDTLRSEISDAGAELIDRLKQTGREALDAARETYGQRLVVVELRPGPARVGTGGS